LTVLAVTVITRDVIIVQKARRSGEGNHQASGRAKTFDREYWKDKRCFKWDETGHPSTNCPYDDDDDDDDDAKSRSSQAKSVKWLSISTIVVLGVIQFSSRLYKKSEL
jgi:hypothetical protein